MPGVMESVPKKGHTYDDNTKLKSIYCFYFKGELYAWTTSKKWKKMFVEQRGDGVFHYKKIKLSEVDERIFYNKFHLRKLIEIPLYDGKNWLFILSTAVESTVLDDSQTQIQDELTTIQKMYEDDDIKNYIHQRVLNIIYHATSIISHRRDSNGILIEDMLEINTFTLFLDLFKETFSQMKGENK